MAFHIAGWQVACAVSDLGRDGAHVTVDFPTVSVTVQNFRGGLQAFWNVCSHRAIKMRQPGTGFGLLRCPYHGWTYNAQGCPVGIPDNDLFFGLDRAARENLVLKRAATVMIGDYLLVHPDASAAPPDESAARPLIDRARAARPACDSGT